MTELPSSTAAIVVIYHPQVDPRPMLDGLRGRVALTVVVDNAPDGHPVLPAIAERSDLLRLHNGNLGGLAGAYNRALAQLRTGHPALSQVILLDEDTDPAALARFLADPDVVALARDAGSACVAAAYKDRATGLRGRYIELDRFRLAYLPRRFNGLRRVAFVINSMSLWRLDALRQIGPFNEGLGIDHVDTEYCLRARALGLAVRVHGDHEFAHTIGQRRRFTLFGRTLQAGGHSAMRRYLIGRNTAWLARRYLLREPAFAFLCLSRLAYEAVGIALAEDGRMPKLWALTRGAVVGVFTWRMA